MKFSKLLVIILCAASFNACSPKVWQITSRSSANIPLDSTTEALADKNYEKYLQPFKQKIDTEMNIVIGQAAETMRPHAPESLLSNFCANVYLHTAADFAGSKIDIAVVNLGGLRTVIPAGNITVRKVFELMPFENELVIVWLKGDKLFELLQFFAKVGGEGVSGLRMEISHGSATNISISGEPLDTGRLYSIATNDYLAGGNDKMFQLAMYEKRINTGIKIRNMLLNYIKMETKNGNKIQSSLDGRISVH
ncbi:MAG: 5'-nucleotidase [Paludibacter sp.]